MTPFPQEKTATDTKQAALVSLLLLVWMGSYWIEDRRHAAAVARPHERAPRVLRVAPGATYSDQEGNPITNKCPYSIYLAEDLENGGWKLAGAERPAN